MFLGTCDSAIIAWNCHTRKVSIADQSFLLNWYSLIHLLTHSYYHTSNRVHPGTTQTTKMYSHKWIVNNTYLLTIEPRLRLWILSTAQKWSFYEGFLQLTWPNPQETADSVTFTEKILQGKLHFLRSDHNFIEQILFQYISCLKLFTAH